MPDVLHLNRAMSQPVTDPTTGSGEVFLFPQAMGQDGAPYAFLVEDPPHKTRPRHHHHGDVTYVYTRGEHHVAGEGVYKPGDIRWVRAGHDYGPETTGPEGGAWWVFSMANPLPVDVAAASLAPAADGPAWLPRFQAPYDWAAIDAALAAGGAAILQSFSDPSLLLQVDAEIDSTLAAGARAAPDSGSALYDMFLGHNTLRLHGLLEKAPSSAALIGDAALLACATRMMADHTTSVLLNAGELIQIGPGEAAQYLHRDTDSWPALAAGGRLVLINAIIALDDFTLANGATDIAPASWAWQAGRAARPDELQRAVMRRGDAVLFRGDLLHGGGANATQARRRALSISYCAGWLRPVENSFLNISPETARGLPGPVRALLGYAAHDALAQGGGLLGLYEGGDPARFL